VKVKVRCLLSSRPTEYLKRNFYLLLSALVLLHSTLHTLHDNNHARLRSRQVGRDQVPREVQSYHSQLVSHHFWVVAYLTHYIAHAKAVFVEGLTKDTDLDVVTGTVKGYTAAWVVAYVKKNDGNGGLRLITLLQSLGNPNVEEAYQALIIALRSKMSDAISESRNKQPDRIIPITNYVQTAQTSPVWRT